MIRRATLGEIAKKAGVSTATVSRSLGQSHLIHPATRVRILNIAMESGYKGRAGQFARARRGSSTLGILIDPQDQSLPSSLFLHGVALEAERNQLLLRIEKWHGANEPGKGAFRLLPLLVENRRVDALILPGDLRPGELRAFAQRLPLVGFQRKCEGVAIDVVEGENGGGSRRIVAHLAARGHRRIGWVGTESATPFFHDRAAGFFLGCLDRGLAWEPENFLTVPSLDAGRESFLRALRTALEHGITAFACVSDGVAMEVSVQLSLLGRKIPDDVSLVGHGVEKPRIGSGKRLTSFDPGFIELGRAAVRVALQRLANPLAPPIIQMGSGQVYAGQTVRSL